MTHSMSSPVHPNRNSQNLFVNSALPQLSLLFVFSLFPDPSTQLLVGNITFCKRQVPMCLLIFHHFLEFLIPWVIQKWHCGNRLQSFELSDYSPLSCRLLFDCAFIPLWARCVSIIRVRYCAVRDPTRYEISHSTRSHAVRDPTRWYEIPYSTRNGTVVRDPTR